MSKTEVNHENLTSFLAIGAVLAVIYFAYMISDEHKNFIRPIEQEATLKGYERPQNNSDKSIADQIRGKTVLQLSTKDTERLYTRFNQAIVMYHAKQYEFAIKALDAAILIAPNLPEIYVNMGYAYLGLEEGATAMSAFQRAIDLSSGQLNAYYGLALAYEAEKEYEAALGAMRTFIHLSNPQDPFLAKARSAIWEWEGLLGRIPGVAEAPEGYKPQMTFKGAH